MLEVLGCIDNSHGFGRVGFLRLNQITNEAFFYLFQLVVAKDPVHEKAIAEGLIWASLLALLVKRRLALTLIGSAELSMLKIAKNSALWLMPILASIIHGAWQEITEKLEWAMVYLSKNGKRVGRENPSKTTR